MATFIKGEEVTTTTSGDLVAADVSYELFEKTGEGVYKFLAENREIDFNLDEFNLSVGSHALTVKAKADGYEDSDYSNEVEYTVMAHGTVRRAIPLIAVPYAYTNASSTFNSLSYRASTYGNIKAGDTLQVINPDATFDNRLLVYKVDASGTPEFADGTAPGTETYISDLRASYAAEDYTFEEDCRFLAVMMDNNNSTGRDYASYCPFCLYKLERTFTLGEPTAIHAYYGTYDIATGKYVLNTSNTKLRALAVLDLNAGDTVECATDDLRLNVIKLNGLGNTGGTVLIGSTTETSYVTKSWTSDVEQRVLVIAKSLTNASLATDDLNAVFKVTFNS